MLKRLSATLIILGGLALVVVPFTEHVWSGAAPAKAMITSFEPVMNAPALHVIQTDLQQLSAADQQLTTQTMPALATQLHLSPAQLQQATASNFPAVATGMAQLPGILHHFDTYGGLLQSQLANFHEASTIPTSGVPITLLPWGFLAVGIIAIVIGAAMFFRRSKAPAIAALALGLAVVIGSLALSFPHKAVSADHMITGLRPVMTAQSAAGMGASLGVVGAMISQMEGQMLPYVATQLKMPPAAFNAFLGSQFPAVATALKNMPTTSATFAAIHNKIASNISNYDQAAAIPSMTFLIWLFLGVGAIGILGGVGGLVGAPTAMRREEVPAVA